VARESTINEAREFISDDSFPFFWCGPFCWSPFLLVAHVRWICLSLIVEFEVKVAN